MVCDICHQRPAVAVRVTVVNGVRHQQAYCQQCLAEAIYNNQDPAAFLGVAGTPLAQMLAGGLDQFLAQVFGQGFGMANGAAFGPATGVGSDPVLGQGTGADARLGGYGEPQSGGSGINEPSANDLGMIFGNFGNAAMGQRARRRTGQISSFARDLVQMARDGRLDPVVGREKEINRLIEILGRKSKNNAVLVGDPGVGKTAIVEGLAQRIAAGQVPEFLAGKHVWALDMAGTMAGTKYRGEFEARMQGLLEELKNKRDGILFIDELHTVLGAGDAEGGMDAANILKPVLARGEIQVIGATTLDEYRRYIEKDGALSRRFQPVMVGEPTPEETVAILRGLAPAYEKHHNVKISPEALEAAVRLTSRYVRHRFQPDKAIDVMDEAMARAAIDGADEGVTALRRRLEEIKAEKAKAVANQEFERAAALRDEERSIQAKLADARSASAAATATVGPEDIARVVSEWTGIPVERIGRDESARLINLAERMSQRVIGQRQAIDEVARAIRRARSGLKDPRRPIGSFLFLGPTGVGKTETARTLAAELFGSEDAMIRIDMSEYMEGHTVSRLIGSPPGYVGYEDAGQLTEAVRRRPYAVILLDEFEKAHPDVQNVLLQVLEDGRLTDGQGRTVDFSNTVIIMTSNLGTNVVREKSHGFVNTSGPEPEYSEQIRRFALSHLRPEFVNRLDAVVVFNPLGTDELRQTVRIMVQDLQRRLDEQHITLSVTDAAVDLILRHGFDPVYGARPLRRALSRLVEDRLADMILAGQVHPGDRIEVDAREGEIVLGVQAAVKQ